MPDITVQVFAGTDVGQAREHNEDAFAVVAFTPESPSALDMPSPVITQTLRVSERGLLFMVADGMGGAAAGEIASSMAIDILRQEMTAYWSKAVNTDPAPFALALEQAASYANARIHQYAADHEGFRGMGTTATIVGVLGSTLYLAQVGDSRAYLVRGGQVMQMTKDQSLMQRLIDAGEITVEEAEVSERRNIILQALGPEPSVNIDVTYQPLRRGDLLIMCTDGLSGVLRDEEIARTALETRYVADVGTRLIATANAQGGPDNITVIVARFDGPGLNEAIAGDDVGHFTFPLPGVNQRAPSAPPFTDENLAVTQEMITIAVVPPRPSPFTPLRIAMWVVILAAAVTAFLLLHHS